MTSRQCLHTQLHTLIDLIIRVRFNHFHDSVRFRFAFLLCTLSYLSDCRCSCTKWSGDIQCPYLFYGFKIYHIFFIHVELLHSRDFGFIQFVYTFINYQCESRCRKVGRWIIAINVDLDQSEHTQSLVFLHLSGFLGKPT